MGDGGHQPSQLKIMIILIIIIIIIIKECCKEHVQSICYLLAMADKMIIKKIRIINRFKSVVGRGRVPELLVRAPFALYKATPARRPHFEESVEGTNEHAPLHRLLLDEPTATNHQTKEVRRARPRDTKTRPTTRSKESSGKREESGCATCLGKFSIQKRWPSSSLTAILMKISSSCAGPKKEEEHGR
jgi:hypothetical protein